LSAAGAWQHAPVTSAALDRARSGDADAFRELTAPHLPELHRHCYRMLGSVTDADDVLQEILVAAWRGLDGFAERSSLRTWLYRIATTRCLNEIRGRKRRPPIAPVPPFDPPEPSRRDAVPWLQPYPDDEAATGTALGPAARYELRESVELAFVMAVQRLPPRQIAAVLLCDVLAFSTAEAAAMLDTTATAVKGALQRARSSLDRAPEGDAEAARGGSAAEQDLARRFADAFTRDDIDGVVALLTDDAWLAMPPAAHEYQGPEAIAAFLHASRRWRAGRRFGLVPTRANNRPAFGCYLAEDGGAPASPVGLIVLEPSGTLISRVTRFLGPALPMRFGLPATLA
jgi:RNA polymerase sigma-70 factor (TIGR02960 family)